MGRYTVIPSNTFDALQIDAGVLLKRFDPANPAKPADEDIICATTGGINPSCVPSYSDYGEDVDNVPANMLELKHLDSWDCKITTTGLGTSPELIKMALGAADIPGTNAAKIVPRRDLDVADFASSIWWVGDKANGGLVAIELKNALSTGGFSLQTTKNGKGQVALEFTGHVSIDDQNTVPMVFYSYDPSETVLYGITQNLTNVTSSLADTEIEAGHSLEATLEAETGYTMGAVTVTMEGVDITSTSYNSVTGVVSIDTVTGDVVITATATEE